MGIGETITVVNKSGKVVSTSKHLVNIFKGAKSAYRERKAEIKASRKIEFEDQQALQNLTINDGASVSSSRRSSRHSESEKSSRSRLPFERGFSDSFYTNDQCRAPRIGRSSGLMFEQDVTGITERNEIVRRHTDGMLSDSLRPRTARSSSMSDIDMDLAYGELPPPLPVRRRDDEAELRMQMSKLQQLLDEAKCVQSSVMATIENLQKNPDALAAVALTLAEISNMASKMAPGVLTAMKGSFPIIIAILASPEFMIAAGVGIGVTVIALGGYKIIKKIKQRKADKADADSAADFDELREIGSDLSRIEMWRRGVSSDEAASLGTSVDEEFMTPAANRMLLDQGVIRGNDIPSTKSSTAGKKSRSRNSKSERDSRERQTKKKEPSGLKMLFKSHKQQEVQLI